MTKAQEKANEVYPECMVYNDYAGMMEDTNFLTRIAYEEGYEQAEKDAMEKVCDWLEKNAHRYVVNFEHNGVKLAGLHDSLVPDLKEECIVWFNEEHQNLPKA